MALTSIRTVVVLGTRPEAIKLMPVLRAMASDPRFEATSVFTGQHRELVAQVLDPYGLRADINLDVLHGAQSLNDIVARVVGPLDAIFARLAPDMVIVQGDTTSAFCAALAAFHRRIPVAHVEAGLRSFDLAHPFPEESNRRMIGAVTSLHLAPTPVSAANLTREGHAPETIFVTGNTSIDALGMAIETWPADRLPVEGLRHEAPMVLVTLHRRESWLDDHGEPPLHGVLRAIAAVARRHPEVDFVFPVHPNPAVRRAVAALLDDVGNVLRTEPLAHGPFVAAMRRARVILTDSGGVQEEAPSLGVPVLVARRCTERPEGVDAGCVQLVGLDEATVRDALERHLVATEALRGVAAEAPRGVFPCPNPFGDGHASERILQAVCHRVRDERPPFPFVPPKGTP